MDALTTAQRRLMDEYDPALKELGFATLFATLMTLANACATLVNDIRAKLKGDYIISKPALAIGSTVQNVASVAFDYLIGGVKYTKAAVAAGTALSGDTVPQNKYGAWRLEIGLNGTIDTIAASDNATGYTTAALAIAGIPAVSANHASMGAVTAINTGGTFVPGTTALDGAGVTDAYTDANTVFESISAAVTG